MWSKIEQYFLEQYNSLSGKAFRKVRLQFYFIVISILFALGYVANTYLTKFILARYLMVISILYFSFLLIGIKWRWSYNFIAQGFIGGCWSIIFILSLFSGGIESFVLPWLVMIPIVALVLSSYLSTWIWAVFSILTLTFFYVINGTIEVVPKEWVTPATPILTVSLHSGLILIVLWLTYIFDTNQHAFITKIEKQNEELIAIDEELRQSVEELSATQELLAEKEAESRSIVEALREHFLITEFDTEGNVIYANQKVIDMTRSIPIGLNRFKQMDESMREIRLKEWEKIVGGESNSSESAYTVQGYTFWVMSTYAPIQNRLGKVSKILSVAHEITATKKREREISEVNEKLSTALNDIKKLNSQLEERVRGRTIELEEKNKYLAEYAFINSHVLRAPLCRLMGLIQLLNYTDISTADSELLDYLRKASEELDGVVGRINMAIEKGSYFDREIIRGNLK